MSAFENAKTRKGKLMPWEHKFERVNQECLLGLHSITQHSVVRSAGTMPDQEIQIPSDAGRQSPTVTVPQIWPGSHRAEGLRSSGMRETVGSGW